MSESHVFKVPDDLHGIVESAYMEFAAKNPVLSMGADERRAKLKECLLDPTIANVVACAAPPPEYAKELGFDPDDETVLQCLKPYKSAHEFLILVRGWPRSRDVSSTRPSLRSSCGKGWARKVHTTASIQKARTTGTRRPRRRSRERPSYEPDASLGQIAAGNPLRRFRRR